MKQDQIKLGTTYMAKVTDRIVPVRINAENRHGGWDATNLITNKPVRIKSAQRLRGPAEDKIGKAVAKVQANDAAANAAAVVPASTPTTKATKTKAGKAPKATPPVKEKSSGLDVALRVLNTVGEPMRCKDMVEKMLAEGLWKTDGKTPAATIYSAILREIQHKGSEARFKTTDRGLFTVNTK